MSESDWVHFTHTNAGAILPPRPAFCGRIAHKPRTRNLVSGRAIWYPPLLGTPGYLHPVRKASSPPSFVTLNSPRGPVSGVGWEGRPPLCSPAMTRLLPSALGSHPLCVATSSAVDQRGRAPGAPARANHPRPRRMRLRDWLTPVGESPRISGFHGKLLL